MNWIKPLLTRENLRLLISYIGLLIECLIPAAAIAFSWYFLRKQNIHIGKVDEAIIKHFLTAAWFIYGYFAKDAIAECNAQYKKIIACLRLDKELGRDKFRRIREQGMAFWNHATIALVSFFIVVMTFMMHYEANRVGFIFVFATVYLLYFLFRVAISLEDPTGGIWRIKNLRNDWLEEK